MTTRIIVQPEAEADVSEAFRWYESRRSGLGAEFIAEVDQTFARIAENPRLTRPRYRGSRRVYLRRFPYAVLYVLIDDNVHVLGVLYERSSPQRFRSRLRP